MTAEHLPDEEVRYVVAEIAREDADLLERLAR